MIGIRRAYRQLKFIVSGRGRATIHASPFSEQLERCEDARAIVDQDGATEITTRLRHGDVVEAISEIEDDARVIVLGKRGEAADFAKGHLGSNLERIVRAAHRPVFVASRAFKPIVSVLVAYDGGSSAMKAVDHISRSPGRVAELVEI